MEEFRECASLYPALFKRAMAELRGDAGRAPAVPAPAPPAPPPPAPAAETETAYPMDVETRRRVIEIEGLIVKLGQDFLRLKAYGLADDILLRRCRKLVDQARDSISRRRAGDVQVRLLDITLDNLAKTWRQVRSQLQASNKL